MVFQRVRCCFDQKVKSRRGRHLEADTQYLVGEVWLLTRGELCAPPRHHSLVEKAGESMSKATLLTELTSAYAFSTTVCTGLRNVLTPFFRLIVPGTHAFFWSHFGDRDGVWGSRRLCGRRRKPRLEPDVRSNRFVIVREISNGTPFRVATFTRATPPFHEMPNTSPIGLFPTGTINRKNGVPLHHQLFEESLRRGWS